MPYWMCWKPGFECPLSNTRELRRRREERGITMKRIAFIGGVQITGINTLLVVYLPTNQDAFCSEGLYFTVVTSFNQVLDGCC